MRNDKFKSIAIKIVKYTGISIMVILALMFVTPFIFSERIKEEIKKAANTKLNAELDYSDAEVSFFRHFPSLTLTLNDFKLNGSAPYTKEKFITAKEVSFGIDVSSLLFSSAISVDQIYLNHATHFF